MTCLADSEAGNALATEAETYLCVPLARLSGAVSVFFLFSLPVSCSYTIPFLHAHPPQFVEVVPALLPELLGRPCPPVCRIFGRGVDWLFLGIEEVP